MQKLGTLIQRNPKATFTVEGYTDSFGTFEYNLDLSQRRADSVKRYLVKAMGINPAQIETRGYGPAKFRAESAETAQSRSKAQSPSRDRGAHERRVIVNCVARFCSGALLSAEVVL